MNRGYIKLWRCSVDNKDYFCEPFTRWQAWIDLILLANHKESRVYIRGIPVDIMPGQVLAGEQFLSERWQWSREKVRSFLFGLSSDSRQQISQKVDNKIRVISILNWEIYQENQTTEPTTDQTTKQTTEKQQIRQQKDIPKNGKNNIIKDNNVIDIFNYWNSKKIICHRELTETIRGRISAKLGLYTVQEIQHAIDNYSHVLSDPDKYWLSHRWTIPEFFDRAFEKCLDDVVCEHNYRRSGSKPIKHETDPNLKYVSGKLGHVVQR